MAKKQQKNNSPKTKKTGKSNLLQGGSISGSGINYSTADSARVRSRQEASQIITIYRPHPDNKVDAAGYSSHSPIPVAQRQIGSNKVDSIKSFKGGLSGTLMDKRNQR